LRFDDRSLGLTLTLTLQGPGRCDGFIPRLFN